MQYNAHSSDDALIKGCIAMDRKAQHCLYHRFYSLGMNICMRYASDRDEALEVVNMAFLKVFQHIDRYQPLSGLGAWISRIVFRTAIDYVRSRNSYTKTIVFPEYQESPVTVPTTMDHDAIMGAIQGLPDMHRAVFSLYAIDGYRHKEIAEMFEIDETTSRWYLSQARKLLRRVLEKTRIYQERL